MLNRLLAILATIAAALAVFFGVRSKQHAAESERDRQRADGADAVNATNQRINEALRETEQRHRHEQQIAEESEAKGERNHLDNRW
jgi:hypothetical protein